MLKRLGRAAVGGAFSLAFAACGSGGLGPSGSIDGFVDSGGTSIYYIIDLPEGEGPFQAIVYGPGSGNAPANLRHHVSHAQRLIELGYAVVRYDKRGTGRSEGEVPSLSTGNSETVVPQLAADMMEVLRGAQDHEEIDSERLALFGLSQAAWYLPIVATEFPEVQFVIMVTGGLTPVDYQNYWKFFGVY